MNFRLFSWLLLPVLALLAVMIPAALGKCRFFEADAASADLSFMKKTLENGVFYAVTVPAAGAYEVVPALAEQPGTLETLETFIERENPLAAINGGFFDPANGKAVSYVTLDGLSWDDPALNEGLTGNTNLKPYMAQFFNRSEFRRYICNGGIRYDITSHDTPVPDHCTLASALGAGPLLSPEYRAREEAFTDYDDAGKMIRDSIGTVRPNARSAVGITGNGDIILAMMAMKPGEKTSGVTLEQMRDMMTEAGAVRVLSLDGGSSSGIHFRGNTFYGKFSDDGAPVKRPLRSILMVQPKE